MSATFVLLDGVTTSVTGSSFELPVLGRRVAWMVYNAGPGGIDQVDLEGSFDGVKWFVLDSANSTRPPTDVPELVRYIRAVYGQTTGTGTLTVQALQSDEDG